MINPAILKTNKDRSISYNQQTLAATIHINDNTLEKKIIKETQKDTMIQEMIENSAENKKITKDNKGIVYMHNLIYVPKSMRNKIMALHHDSPLHRHPGTKKTAEKIAQNYYFPNLRKTVQGYVKNCEVCIQDKASRHQPYGKMQSLDTPKYPWEWITVDFITQLPPSYGYNTITVYTEQLTKYVHTEPLKGTMTAEDMTHQFLKVIVSNHGVPKRITSDRDKLFTTKFWMTLTNLMGINH